MSISAFVFFSLCVLALTVRAQPPLPITGQNLHLGVATCAGSTCHGAVKPFKDSTVEQDEFVLWRQKDKHSKAYSVLLEDKSKRMASKLGLKAAHEARICLVCHSDFVEERARGKRFQLSDGVGCEACHGGSEKWLGGHVSGQNSHADNVNDGLYPTEEPVARARLCLSCHLGNKDRFITHRIMGAGHPRLSFELDTFTVIQPAHFRVDKDYRERKDDWSGIRVWAIGQLFAVQQYLENLQEPSVQTDGMFPELVFFDCQACHHSLDDVRWTPRASSGLQPGSVRLNDANLLVLRQLLDTIAPGYAKELAAATRNLHKASEKSMSNVRAVAGSLSGIVDKVSKKVEQHRFSVNEMKAVLQGIVTGGGKGHFNDLSAAEQVVMAAGAIVSSLEQSGKVAKGNMTAMNKAMDTLYAALEDEKKYRPTQFRKALKKLGAAL